MEVKKPSNVTYGVNENPPFWMTLGQGFQHICAYAILLNLFFRIGIAKKVTLALAPRSDSLDQVVQFMEKNGSVWGARKEVISKSISAINEFLEAAIAHGLTDRNIQLEVAFDEFNLDVDLWYSGKLLQFPAPPYDMSKILDNKAEQLKLSCHLMEHQADKISTSTKGGRAHIHLHFEH